MTPIYAIDRSGPDAVLRHLQAHDAAFRPPLSSRVDLPDYARKLADHALRLEAWDGDLLVGLVAVYCNAPDRDAAFVSNVSVFASYAGRGIGRRLMLAAIDRVRVLGFSRLFLDVDPRAGTALRLYAALGFQAESSGTAPLRMTLPLGPTAQGHDGQMGPD